MGTRRDRAGSPVQPYKTARKCPKHNAWKKTSKYHPELGAICELCALEQDERNKQLELAGGSNKHLYQKNKE
jgi:hypothetical protein